MLTGRKAGSTVKSDHSTHSSQAARSGKATQVAFGGMLAAVSLLLMLLTRAVPFSEMALPGIAGVLLIFAVMEMGAGWALVIYVAVSLLSLLVAFENGAALYYILFFGLYPIVKNYVERIPLRPAQWAVKLAVCNACAAAVYFATVKLFGAPGLVARYGAVLVLIAVNVVFFVYDYALSRLIVLYVYKIRKMLHLGPPSAPR